MTRHEKSVHADIYSARVQHTAGTPANQSITSVSLPRADESLRDQLTPVDVHLQTVVPFTVCSTVPVAVRESPPIHNAYDFTQVNPAMGDDDGMLQASQTGISPLETGFANDIIGFTSARSESLTSEQAQCAQDDAVMALMSASTNEQHDGTSFQNFQFDPPYRAEYNHFSWPHGYELPYDATDFFTEFPASESASNRNHFNTINQPAFCDPSQDDDRSILPIHRTNSAGHSQARSDSFVQAQGVPQSLAIDKAARHKLLADLQSRMSSDQRQRLRLPSASLLNRFLGTYLVCFHPHYPILHIPTMSLENTPSPLILALCSIGALYRLHRKQAAYLQQWVDITLKDVSNVFFLPSASRLLTARTDVRRRLRSEQLAADACCMGHSMQIFVSLC